MEDKTITLILEDDDLTSTKGEPVDIETFWTLETSIEMCKNIRRFTGQKIILYAVDDMMTITFDV